MGNHDNFCKAFGEKVVNIKGLENKMRFFLEDFFFNEGWASRSNPRLQKEGYSARLTYNESTIKHFIEDFVRYFQGDWEKEWQKVMKHLSKVEKEIKERK